MKIVIEIPDDKYKTLVNPYLCTRELCGALKMIVSNGIVLPKGCGRLIDADELRARMYHEAFETDTDYQRWDSGCWIRYKMFEQIEETAPTIIPADKEAEKQVTGRWIRKMDAYRGGYVECSVCGTPYKYIDPKELKTCMLCHARMEESE